MGILMSAVMSEVTKDELPKFEENNADLTIFCADFPKEAKIEFEHDSYADCPNALYVGLVDKDVSEEGRSLTISEEDGKRLLKFLKDKYEELPF